MITIMNWIIVGSTVFPLAGVALGAAGTLMGQHLATRADMRRDASLNAKELRAERKEAIISFIDADAQIERYREDVAADRKQSDGELTMLLHSLWRAKKILELVCSGTVSQAGQNYAHALDVLVRKAPGARPSTHERELRVTFLEAARREMGYSGDPLIRPALAQIREADTAPDFTAHS